MHFSKATVAAILAFVQSSVLAQQNMVTLGQSGNLQFLPNTMTVNAGDNVTFAFMSATHSVASTSLSQPNVADNQIYSGLIPVDNTTPTPPGTKLPRNKLRIRAIGSNPELDERALGNLLGGGNKGNGANANNGNANNGNANNGNANNGNANNGQTAQSTGNTNNPATFTVQMNQVGMQAMICDQAQHAANGMIMMIQVLPTGQQKRQTTNDQALQQALTQYLAVGQNTKTQQASANPGTGGTLNGQAQNLLQNGGTTTTTNTGGKKKAGKKAAGAGGGIAAALAGGN